MRLFLAALAALLLVAGTAQAQGFTATYQSSHWGSCSGSARIYGNEPAAVGKYPVVLYTHGTLGVHNGAEAKAFVDRAAQRGFVAASVSYDSIFYFSARGLDLNARCIYGPGNSALARVCARPKADCSRLSVAGFSQGAALAIRATRYGARRALLYGYALDYVDWQNRADVLIVDGEGEDVDPAKLARITPNWIVVPNGAMQDGRADHCWMHGGGGCSWWPPLDRGWLDGSEPWSLNPTLDWLR
jgi:dienelactone hydrolase